MKKYLLTLFFLSFVLMAKSQYITIELDNADEDGLIPLTFHTDKTAWDSIRIYYKITDDFEWLHTLNFSDVHYTDTVHCEGNNITYQADLYHEGTMIAKSNELLVDEADPTPQTPILDSISYVNGQLMMGWTTIPDSTLMFFQIFKREMGLNHLIQKINNPNASFVTLENEEVNPCENQDKLILVANDKCNESPNLLPEYAQALTVIDYLNWDKCEQSIMVQISDYITSSEINQEITKHQVWVSENGAPYFLLGEVNKNEDFVHTGVEYNKTYTYFIRTFLSSNHGNATSSSCPKSITTEQVTLPEHFRMAYSTVIPGTNTIKSKITVDAVPSLDTLVILRSEDNVNFTQIQKLTWNNNTEIEWIDESVNPNQTSYYYRAGLLDECGNVIMTSENTTRTILLAIVSASNENRLTWNQYEGDLIKSYEVLRFMDNQFNPDAIPIIEINPGQEMIYVDFSQATEGVNQWSYVIKAVSLFDDFISYSNMVTSNNESIVKFANAFIPSSSISPVFKPLFSGVSPKNYEFQIFNRWGQLIFSTTNLDEGWDGKHNGELVKQGSYVYQLLYHDHEDKAKSIKGTVVVIK